MNLWKIIDTVITLPAWIVGYIYYAYKNTFMYGGACYRKNLSKYWRK